MAVKSMIRKSEKVENTQRRFGSATEYYPAYVENLVGEIRPALFTQDAIAEAIRRAEKNPEDVPERATWLDKIFG